MPTTPPNRDPIPSCPRCHSNHVVRNGKTQSGSPNLLCRGCNRRFVARPRKGPVSEERKELIRRLLARAALEHRSDDTEDVIRRRLALYHEVTHPIVDWYRTRGILVSVDAMRPVGQVAGQVLTALEAMSSLVDLVPEDARRPIDLTGLEAAFGDG